MNFKVVISDPKGKRAYQKEIDQRQSGLMGKKIREKVSGNPIGLAGYELEITGGSDRQGFPMRSDIEGIARKRVLVSHPPGFHPRIRGQRKRKSIRGNAISSEISQVNIKVITYGKDSLDRLFGVKAESVAEKKEEKPKEEKVREKVREKPKSEKPVEEKMGVKEIEKAESEVESKTKREKTK
jgi:small subunit ribosomal protein S6e